jgi:MFS family permease
MGMITIGYLGDRVGRKWGSVTTVSIMFVRCLPVWRGMSCICNTCHLTGFWCAFPAQKLPSLCIIRRSG